MASILAPSGLAALIATLGIPDAIAYFSARYGDQVRQYILRAAAIATASGVAVCIVLLILEPVLLRQVTSGREAFVAIALTMPMNLVVGVLRGAAQGSQMFAAVNRERWLSTLTRVCALVALAFLNELTIGTAAVTTWFAGMIGVVCYIPLLVKTHRDRRRGATASPSQGSLLGYGLRIWGGSLSGLIVLRVDQVILSLLAGPSELGLYVVAVAVAEIPQTAVGSIRQILVSRTVRGLSVEEIVRTFRVVAGLATAASASGILLVPIFVPLLFGPTFSAAIFPTQVLLIGTIPLAAKEVLAAALLGFKRPGSVTAGQLSALIATIVCTFPLTAWLGATGAALASVGAYSVYLLALMIVFARFSQLSLVVLLFGSRKKIATLTSNPPAESALGRHRAGLLEEPPA